MYIKFHTLIPTGNALKTMTDKQTLGNYYLTVKVGQKCCVLNQYNKFQVIKFHLVIEIFIFSTFSYLQEPSMNSFQTKVPEHEINQYNATVVWMCVMNG
jgi:hypothetical protein